MTSRREFLQIGITATAWPLAPAAVRAAEEISSAPLPLYKVIFDRRFAVSVEFAERAKSLGLATHGITGDMTQFWYDELYHRWKAGPAAIAGLTAHGPMFCFEQLARDQGMRVVFRAEHKLGPAGLVHTLTGPLAMLDGSMALERGWRWGALALAAGLLLAPMQPSQAQGGTTATRLAALEAKLSHFSIQNIDGKYSVVLSGANLYVVNGTGSTTTSMAAAPLSGTYGCRQTSTGNDTFTSE